MPDAGYQHAIAALSALGHMRVWSMIVTVFGDLAPDHPLDGPTLSALMDRLGIRPEAMRVALHRLRADDWITSEKKGRISQYSLTPKGRKASMTARSRIYAHPKEIDGPAQFVLMPRTEPTLDPENFVAVAPRLYLCAQGTTCPQEAMILSPTGFPEWLGTMIEPAHLRRGYDALYDVLEQIEADRTKIGDLTPHETAIIRVMIVHAWRRLVLKHPILPRTAHSADWRGHDCRALVTQLLDRHPRPTTEQLNRR